jgi:hypothetical protein
MAKAKIVQVLSFTLPNKVGQLSAVGELIGAAKVNVDAILAMETGAGAEFRIITAKNAKVRKALAPLGVELREEDTICVQMANKAGRLDKVAKKLADAAVNVNRVWATGFGGKSTTLVLQTSDDKKALAVLKATPKKKK